MQRFLSPRTLASCSILGLLLVAPACKSQLDGKQAAKVQDAPAKPATPQKAAEKPAAAPAAAADQANAGNKLPLASSSKVEFVGAKVTGDHTGSFSGITGHATLAGSKVSGLKVEIKTDSVSSDSTKLTAHLKSADFFDVEKFPASTFESSKIDAKIGAGGTTHELAGTLNLHGVSKLITFPAKVMASSKGAKIQAEFKINRKDFGIVYPGRKDDLIKDDVLLKIDLNFGA